MDLELTEEQKAIKEAAKRFADKEIIPFARENDEKELFPWDIVKKMAPLGYLGGPVPPEYGGPGMEYISYAIFTEEIGRACSSVRTVLSVHISLVQLTLLQWGTEDLKQEFLPKMAKGEWLSCYGLTEPDSGSDAASIKTRAVQDGDYWVLNGRKMWISNGGVADVALIIAQTDPSKKHKGMVAFMVPTKTPGFSTRDIHGKLGLRSSNTAELILEDVRVPKEYMLGKVGDGFKVAMSALDNGRYSVAAGCVGICQASLEASISYAKERYQFGKPIASFQLVQALIADTEVDTQAARLLVWRAGHVKNKGVRSTIETSTAKYFASEAAIRCANRAIQVHGGYGYSNEYPVERYLRDARVATLYEGTSQIQQLILGSHLTGIKAFV